MTTAKSRSSARAAGPRGAAPKSPVRRFGTAPRRFGIVQLVAAIAEHAKSARCANDLDRMVVLERMRLVFESEPEVLLSRGFDKAYRQVMEGV